MYLYERQRSLVYHRRVTGKAGSYKLMTLTDEGELHATLTCTSGKYLGKTFHVKHNATIGRNGDNSILLDAMVVSNQHARIFWDKDLGSFVIEDLGSRTGIMVDDDFVDDRLAIADGQSITIANEFRFTFHVDTSEPDDQIDETGTVDERHEAEAIISEPEASVLRETSTLKKDLNSEFRVPAEETTRDESPAVTGSETSGGSVLARGNKSRTFYLERRGADNEHVTFTLTEGINLVGRDPSNTIHLNDSSVSRHHAVIVVKDASIVVRDLDSKNHTFVDGIHVDHEKEMKVGSILLFGLVAFNVCEQ